MSLHDCRLCNYIWARYALADDTTCRMSEVKAFLSTIYERGKSLGLRTAGPLRGTQPPMECSTLLRVSLTDHLPLPYTESVEAVYSQASLLSSSALSENTLNFVKEKPSECISTHTQCHEYGKEGFCPSRLIDVRIQSQSSSKIYLVDSPSSAAVAYCTLSHKWDGNVPCQLTYKPRDN